MLIDTLTEPLGVELLPYNERRTFLIVCSSNIVPYLGIRTLKLRHERRLFGVQNHSVATNLRLQR